MHHTCEMGDSNVKVYPTGMKDLGVLCKAVLS